MADLRSSHQLLRSNSTWKAGLLLLGLFTIAVCDYVQTFAIVESTRSNTLWTRRAAIRTEQDVGSFGKRQAADAQQCSAISNCTNDLIPFMYKPLPLGSIKPLGWLYDEMQGMADGLAGHEHDFYPIVRDSRWMGGQTDYSSLNEGLPYWFNGLVPLAYGLGNERLIDQVKSVLSEVLSRQDNVTGWLGPVNPDTGRIQSNDTWGRFPFMLGMIQMAEAEPSLAPQIVSSLYHFIPTFYNILGDDVDPNEIWGPARYQDAIITMQWLYENYPQLDGTDKRALLSNMMYRLKDYGADWIGYYQSQSYLFQDIDTVNPSVEDDGKGGFFKFLHGVNVGQGLKTPAVDYRFTRNESLLEVQRNAIDWTLQYHGSSAGTVVGDERESGQAPNRGSELCTAVEAMYSMSYAYSVAGVNTFADNVERIAFNALPVMITPDRWAHQYIAQPNQPWAAPVNGSAVFWNVGDLGQTFGLAPNYPCCAVNHPQGYPKFVSHSFMTVGDDGLGHILLSPAAANTTLGNGANVDIAALTNYPFSDTIVYTINTDRTFKFYVRVPGWAKNPVVELNGNQVSAYIGSNSLVSVSVPRGQSSVRYTLESTLQTISRANDTIAVYNGALLYALDVGYLPVTSNANPAVTRNNPPTSDPVIQNAVKYNLLVNQMSIETPAEARDWNISNTLPWSYVIDPASLIYFASNDSNSGNGKNVNNSAVSLYAGENKSSNPPPTLPNPIWDYQAPAQYIRARGCTISWDLKGNMPDIPPEVNARNCTGETVDLILRPYGSLKVHMAELPVRALGSYS